MSTNNTQQLVSPTKYSTQDILTGVDGLMLVGKIEDIMSFGKDYLVDCIVSFNGSTFGMFKDILQLAQFDRKYLKHNKLSLCIKITLFLRYNCLL